MGEREIRAKYGGKLAKAINRAIRAEVPGGNEALDKLTQLAGPARQSGWKGKNGQDTPEAEAYFRHQKDVLAPIEAQVRKRWGIPPEKASRGPAPRKAQSRKGPSAPRKTQPRTRDGAQQPKKRINHRDTENTQS